MTNVSKRQHRKRVAILLCLSAWCGVGFGFLAMALGWPQASVPLGIVVALFSFLALAITGGP